MTLILPEDLKKYKIKYSKYVKKPTRIDENNVDYMSSLEEVQGQALVGDWIKTEDELPEKWKDSCYSIDVHFLNNWNRQFVGFYDFFDKRWCTSWAYVSGVTHWKPLSPSPFSK
jgi:hypothetical protein